ncbi:MAG: hypothetical protein KBF45_05830, partial [Cyclobacteriaceae bacterium]|nr:hypothetical protein [Cyclobacteriaceae bacterium]
FMIKTFLILLFGLIPSISCYSQGYLPPGLRKLDETERLEFVKKGIYPTKDTFFKDSNGKIIENRKSLDMTEISFDYYVDIDNKIIECIVRPITKKDTELWKQIIDFYQDRDWGVITPIKIECDKQKEVLEDVLIKDQQNRDSGQVKDLKVDKENLEKVLDIIENCGFPTLQAVGQKGMTSTFLVIQHSTRKIREKYLPQIKSCAEKGDLSLQEVALMEDRLLMESSEKQKYGTQITSDNVNGGWKLYPVEDLKNVNARRNTMGLGPLQDYVKRWSIELELK